MHYCMQNHISNFTQSVPKIIDQRTHAALDYSTVAALVGMGWHLRFRHRTASNFAFMNAAAVLMTSLLTDYPGGVVRRISFQTHGSLDVMQAGMMACGPALFGFADDPEAKMFYAQAAMEAGVVSATDWSA